MCTARNAPGGPVRCPADAYARAQDAQEALQEVQEQLQASEANLQRAQAHVLIAGLAELDIPAMDDVDCPLTFHIGDHLDLDQKAPDRGGWKPTGLWTAPGRGAGGGSVKTGWMDWDVEYVSGDGDPGGRTVFAIVPEPGAVVVRLDSEADVAAFGRAFPGFLGEHSTDAEAAASWSKVRQAGISGIMVTGDGLAGAKRIVADGRSFRPQDEIVADSAAAFAATLGQWDVSSCCWMDNAAIRVEGTAQPGRYAPAADDGGDPWDEDGYGWWGPRVERGEDFGTYDEGQSTRVRFVPPSTAAAGRADA